MAADPTNDAWMETCLISISKIDGSDMTFHGITETVDFDLGEKDIEGIPILNGGRVTKFSPEGDSTITFEGYALQAGTDSGTVGKGFHDLMHEVDSTVPIRVSNSRTRNKYRVLVMWTNDSTATTAHSATAENASAYRIGMADGYFASVKVSFTDQIVKITATFKCAAYDKSGNSNVMEESCAGADASDVLPAITSYTSSNKFD